MEHPTFIPMYTPTTLQAQRGHMTRPQLYAIGHKMNSHLSEQSLSTCETWLLPPTCVLCMIRYLEESHGATTSNGRASEDAKYKDQEKELPKKLQRADIRTTPDDRPLTTSGRPALGGRPAPEDQPTPATHLQASGRPTPHRTSGNINESPRLPDVRCPNHRTLSADVRR